MNCILEVLGITPPGNGTIPAMRRREDGTLEINPERIAFTEWAAELFADVVLKKIRPDDCMTIDAFLNAMKYDVATGGSTNSDLHLRAIARVSGPDLTSEMMDEASKQTSTLAKITPSRRDIHMEDYHRVGGVSTVVKELARNGLITDTPTVTGKSLLENVAEAPEPDGDIIKSLDAPYPGGTGGLTYLKGNIADNAIVKTAGVEPKNMVFRGRAIVYDSQDAALEGIDKGEIKDGHVVFIIYEGPKGGPGIQEMLRPSSILKGAGIDAAMVTDGRYSGGTVGPCVGHVSPEAKEGGRIRKVKNGDLFEINIPAGTFNLLKENGEVMSIEEIDAREPTFKYESKVHGGWLQVYQACATSADKGAIIDPCLKN